MRYLCGATGLLALFALTLSNAHGQGAPGWGTIKGQIVWGYDKPPEQKPVNVDKDKEHCLSKGPILSEDWVVNPANKGVRWTFVWLDVEPKSGQKLPIHPTLQQVTQPKVTIDQPCCAFEPHALGMRVGQILEVKNSAPMTPHNVNWAGSPLKNPGGNVIVPPKGVFEIKDLKADRFPLQISCNIHPWMKARVAVFDHPYFAVTDANGNFEIKNAPAGNYRLKVYHESMGWRGGAAGRDGEKITVPANGVLDLGKLALEPKQ